MEHSIGRTTHCNIQCHGIQKSITSSNAAVSYTHLDVYKRQALDADNAKYINTLINSNVKELSNLQIGQANVILQELDKKAMKAKYKVAVIKRPVEFSKETYNKAYNDFSQCVAQNTTCLVYTSITSRARVVQLS